MAVGLREVAVAVTKQFKNISGLMAVAATSLLGSAPAVSADSRDNSEDWQFESAFMYYGESERVTAYEGVVAAKKDFGDEHIFNGKITIDTLTGASANGAIAQNRAQTFTRPSGKGQFTVAENEVPLDDTFRDTRLQLNAQWTQPILNASRLSTGLHISKEYDYLSLAFNLALAKDFNQKNTTLSLATSYSKDKFSPEGGRPITFASMVNDKTNLNESEFTQAFEATRQQGDGDKDTMDIILGLTQVLRRDWITQINLSQSESEGYLTDPFKVLSVVNETGITQNLIYERRPDSRSKTSLFAQSKKHFNWGVWDVSYRYSADDWEISSHTIDTRLRFALADGSAITPHFRYYQQSAAEFYRPYLFLGEAGSENDLPLYASADYRLGDLNAYTLGLKYETQTQEGNDWAVRVEYYLQDPQKNDFDNLSSLSTQNLYPQVKALILQFSYRL